MKKEQKRPLSKEGGHGGMDPPTLSYSVWELEQTLPLPPLPDASYRTYGAGETRTTPLAFL